MYRSGYGCKERTKFRYTGIRVRKLDRSIGFYTRAMGTKIVHRGTMQHGGVYVLLRSPGSTQRLQLNRYLDDNPHYTEYRNGEELDHLAFWVGAARKK